MSIEDRIRDSLHAQAARVKENPGRAWDRVAEGDGPERFGRSQPVARGWRRAAVFVTAFAVFAASGGFAWEAFRPSDSGPARRSGGTTLTGPVQPPDWVIEKAQLLATANKDPHPASAEWIRTSADIIAPAVGLTPDQVSGREYLVVLHGDFTFVTKSSYGAVGGPPPKGEVIAFTLDPATRDLRDLSYGDQAVDIPGMHPFSLGDASPTSPRPSISPVSISAAGTVRVPGFTIYAVEEGFGSLWVAGSNGHSQQILRLDPATGAVQHLFPAKQLEAHEWGGAALAIGGGMVWAAAGSEGVDQIDPTTNTISLLPVSTGSVGDVAFDQGSVWVNTFVDKGRYAIASLDPATGEVTGTSPFAAGWSQGVYVAGGTVWVHEHDIVSGDTVSGGSINQVTPGSTRTETIGGSFAEPVTDGQTIYTPFSGDPTAMNLSHGIAQIDPTTGVVLHAWKSDPIGYDIALGSDGALWYLSGTSSGAVLERFNPSTGVTDVRENLGGNPVAVMVSGSTVWVVQYDGWLDRFTLSPN
ncbi:MAG: hypothetical protein QOI81_140 [Actinomycetota bacterium]|jgi:hypothetical protein|nr:hypothetical protein [Actinomycetota bacterium]